VRPHTNGYEVEAPIPGGGRLAISGSSLAAPNAVNLAAKLFALDPSLTPQQVVALIVDAADRSEDGRRVLMNPKRSVERLRARMKERIWSLTRGARTRCSAEAPPKAWRRNAPIRTSASSVFSFLRYP